MHKAMSTEIDMPDGVSSVDAKFVFVDGDRQPDAGRRCLVALDIGANNNCLFLIGTGTF